VESTDGDPDHVGPAIAAQSGGEGDAVYGAPETAAGPEEEDGIKPSARPAADGADRAPDAALRVALGEHREVAFLAALHVFQGSVEFGAAWKKTSGEGRDYRSVKLDDPSSRLRSTPPWSKARGPELQPHLVPPQRRVTTSFTAPCVTRAVKPSP